MKRVLFSTTAWLLLLLGGPARGSDLPVFKLEMKDGVLAPRRLEVPAGRAFRLEVRNAGRTAAEFECKPLRQEKVLPPGAAVVLDIRALEPGEYRFVDEFREDLPTGRGVIVVK